MSPPPPPPRLCLLSILSLLCLSCARPWAPGARPGAAGRSGSWLPSPSRKKEWARKVFLHRVGFGGPRTFVSHFFLLYRPHSYTQQSMPHFLRLSEALFADLFLCLLFSFLSLSLSLSLSHSLCLSLARSRSQSPFHRKLTGQGGVRQRGLGAGSRPTSHDGPMRCACERSFPASVKKVAASNRCGDYGYLELTIFYYY